jgi:hypothetical protein
MGSPRTMCRSLEHPLLLPRRFTRVHCALCSLQPTLHPALAPCLESAHSKMSAHMHSHHMAHSRERLCWQGFTPHMRRHRRKPWPCLPIPTSPTHLIFPWTPGRCSTWTTTGQQYRPPSSPPPRRHCPPTTHEPAPAGYCSPPGHHTRRIPRLAARGTTSSPCKTRHPASGELHSIFPLPATTLNPLRAHPATPLPRSNSAQPTPVPPNRPLPPPCLLLIVIIALTTPSSANHSTSQIQACPKNQPSPRNNLGPS